MFANQLKQDQKKWDVTGVTSDAFKTKSQYLIHSVYKEDGWCL